MEKFIMGIGLPGAGKSRILRPYAFRHGFHFVSPDEIRLELTGNMGDQTRNQEVWEIARGKTGEILRSGVTVVFDATNLYKDGRLELINLGRNAGAKKIIGVYFNTPFEIAQERNLTRIGDMVVPVDSMERMLGFLTESPPEIADGFTTLIELNENAKIVDIKRS